MRTAGNASFRDNGDKWSVQEMGLISCDVEILRTDEEQMVGDKCTESSGSVVKLGCLKTCRTNRTA